MTENEIDATVRSLAERALQAAVDRRYAQVVEVVQDINDHGGAQAIHDAMILWCDTLIAVSGDKLGGPNDFRALTFREASTGEQVPADRMPAEYLWAGRVVMARFLRDEDQYSALMLALPVDEYAIGRHVMALVYFVAINVAAAAQPARRPGTPMHTLN